MKRKLSLIIIALCALALTGCGGPAAEWHPDKDGVGAWFDGQSKRLAVLTKGAGEDAGYELSIFSLDPQVNKMSYNGFRLTGADMYTGDLDERIKLSIKGGELTYTGLYKDGKTFTETYRGVDQAFITGRKAEAEAALKAFEGKTDLGIMDQQAKGGLEMIVLPTLEGIKLPR